MQVQMGKCTMEMNSSQLAELRDANALLSDRQGLLSRMREDGYLLIRGLHDLDKVMAARKVVTDGLARYDMVLPGSDPFEARINPDKPNGAFWGKLTEITHHPDMLALLEGERVMGLFSFLFEEAVRTFNYKWLRVVGRGGSTGAHLDVVYMGRGTIDHLFTVWTPLGDTPIDLGTLCLNIGSNHLPGFEKLRSTYGQMDVDRDRVQGWFSDNPVEVLKDFGGQWGTTDFKAGDALIFTMFTMHGSTSNQTDRMRISTDTRYQPASAPVDERWIGDNPIGHYAWQADATQNKPMEVARAEWGV